MMEMAKVAEQNLRIEREKIRKGMAAMFNLRLRRLAENESSMAHRNLGYCERCNRATYFSVMVGDRRARWCGCE